MVVLSGNSALVSDSVGKIQTIDLDTGLTATLFDSGLVWSDIALNSSGSLYGVSANSIYLIDTTLLTTTLVETIPFASNVNALTFGTDGVLYALDTNTSLTKIDVTNLTLTQVTTSAVPDGDIVFVQGQLFATSGGSLVRIDPTTGSTTTLAGLDRLDVFGLSVSDSGELVGYSDNDVFTIYTGSGVTTTLFNDVSTLSLVTGATSDNDFSSTLSTGSTGAYNLAGTSNADVVLGGGGGDTVVAGGGADLVYGNTGEDLIYGNTGADQIFGGQDVDTVFGGQGNDVVYGNFGSDILYGNFGIDFMYGGRDDDRMFGGQGDDVLRGNIGNDTLYGNLGSDLFYGGSGTDLFGLSGFDTIWDFSSAESDSIFGATASYGVTGGFDVTANIVYSDYTFTNGNSVRLMGVDDSVDISVHFVF